MVFRAVMPAMQRGVRAAQGLPCRWPDPEDKVKNGVGMRDGSG